MRIPPGRPQPSGAAAPANPPPAAEGSLETPFSQRATAYGRVMFDKFNNDWSMNLAAMVAFNVFTSLVPLLLSLVVMLTLIPELSHNVHGFSAQINSILPSDIRRQANVEAWVSRVHSASKLLGVLSIVGVSWGGANLFGGIESAFAIIFRVKTRDIVPQKLMCLIMMLLFTVLLPVSFLSSLVLSAGTTTLGRIIPARLSGPFTAVSGSVAALAALLVLFLAVYIVVPNRLVAWRQAWRGALFSTVVMWLVTTLFPFYAAHFIGVREYSSAAVVTIIVSITWVWLFSLVLILGAQINAISMGIGPWRYDISRILMDNKGDRLPIPAILRSSHRHRPLRFSGLLRDSHTTRPLVLPPDSRLSSPPVQPQPEAAHEPDVPIASHGAADSEPAKQRGPIA
jgi:membrane protein